MDTQAELHEPRATYEQRRARFGTLRDWYERRSYRNANANLALFVAAVAFIGVAIWQQDARWFSASGFALLGLIVALVRHTRIDQMQRRYAELWAINDEGLQRLQRAWATLPLRQPSGSAARASDHLYAHDLDLLGHASLQHLLNTPSTGIGLATLERWLLEPAAPAVVRLRQGAVRELAPRAEFRDDLALHGRLMGNLEPNYTGFVQWAETEPWLRRRPVLVWLSRLLPVITIALVAADVLNLVPWPLWAIGLVINYGLILTVGKRVEAVIGQVSARQSAFRTYGSLFQLLGTQPFAASELRRLQSVLMAGQLRADQQMQRLGRIMALADFRFFLLFFPINLLTLWNFHVLWLLERWQHAAGAHVQAWLVALGEIEALAALATLAHDNPAWTFPEMIEDRPPLVQAQNIGHPLLPPQACVGNDITLGPPATFALVTGSNMSGKSTLLRSIGVNVVLAQAGGPVCATRLQLPPLTLATSMRVQDSLEQGISYFMAELQRLKAVVDAAERVRTQSGRTLLYLLDEILHGTNSTERHIAAQQIIRHLLAQPAIGAVSTHDLTLADEPALASASQLVHFTETFTRDATGLHMLFDYRLRPGIATSSNALKLMELVGLPHDETVGQLQAEGVRN